MSKMPELQFRSPATPSADMASVVQLIEALHNEETRERALLLLSKDRGIREDLAPLLWHSVGTIATLLKEILSVYHLLYSPNLTEKESNRACNALALFQCVATHPETKMSFIKAKIPLYLYPFLNNTNKEKPHEYLRLTSLGVIGALVKVEDMHVIHFLLESEILPCCLRCMEMGSEWSKTVSAAFTNFNRMPAFVAYFCGAMLYLLASVATYIVYKILLNEEGLKYCCSIAERFFAIGRVLGNMVETLAEDGRLAEDTSKRLLKHIIWCYHRLSESPRACDGLKCCFPVKLRDSAFINIFRDDITAMQCLQQLFYNIANRHQSNGQPVGQLLGCLIRG